MRIFFFILRILLRWQILLNVIKSLVTRYTPTTSHLHLQNCCTNESIIIKHDKFDDWNRCKKTPYRSHYALYISRAEWADTYTHRLLHTFTFRTVAGMNQYSLNMMNSTTGTDVSKRLIEVIILSSHHAQNEPILYMPTI